MGADHALEDAEPLDHQRTIALEPHQPLVDVHLPLPGAPGERQAVASERERSRRVVAEGVVGALDERDLEMAQQGHRPLVHPVEPRLDPVEVGFGEERIVADGVELGSQLERLSRSRVIGSADRVNGFVERAAGSVERQSGSIASAAAFAHIWSLAHRETAAADASREQFSRAQYGGRMFDLDAITTDRMTDAQRARVLEIATRLRGLGRHPAEELAEIERMAARGETERHPSDARIEIERSIRQAHTLAVAEARPGALRFADRV